MAVAVKSSTVPEVMNLPAADHDDLVRADRHLAHEVRRDEDGTPLLCEGAEEVADPANALGVEPVHGFVEEQDPRIAQERAGDA